MASNTGSSNFSIRGTIAIDNTLGVVETNSDPDGRTGDLSIVWQSSTDGFSWSNVGSNSTFEIYSSSLSIGNKVGNDFIGNSGDGLGAHLSFSSDGEIFALSGSDYIKIYRSNNDEWNQIGNDIQVTSTGNIASITLSSDGSVIAFGGPYINRGLDYDQRYVRIYQNQNDNWVQLGSDINGNYYGGDYFGNSLQLSDDGKVIAIGIPESNSSNPFLYNSGSFEVYEFNQGTSDWSIIDEKLYGERSYEYSGSSISISGDGKRIAVGSPDTNNKNNFGVTRVYENISGQWIKIGGDIFQEGDDSGVSGDSAGNSVALSNDGSILVVGAPNAGGSYNGEVRVYKESNGNWEQLGEDISYSLTDNNIKFLGAKVSVSDDGSIIAVKSSSNDPEKEGSLRLFKLKDQTWVEFSDNISSKTIQKNSDGSHGGGGGHSSFDLSGNGFFLVVGESQFDNGSDDWNANNGIVEVYKINKNESSEGKYIRAIISYTDDKGFSESVTTSSTSSVAYKDDGEATFSISGSPLVGNALSISEESADPDGTGTLSYSWQTSSDNSSWSVVDTNATYTVGATAEGKSLRAVLSYTDSQGFDEKVTTSSSSIPAVDNGDASFSISRSSSIGNTLSISEDSADPDGTGTLSYSWQTSSDNSSWSVVDTNATYTLTSSEEGKKVRAIISYKDDQGFNESVTTSSSSISYINDGDASFSISGSPLVGNALSISENSADPDGTGTLSYSWQTSSDNSSWSVVGTNETYTVGASAEGKSLRAVLSYTDSQGFDEKVTTSSSSIPAVDNGDASFSIVGTKSVGNYLSIKRDSEDPDGTGELSYQWQSSSDGSTWSNESTNSTYRLKYTDSDKYYKATISYTDDDDFSESITTDTIQIDKHSMHNSLESLKTQLSNLTYSTSFDYTSLGYSEEFGSSSGDTLYAGENEIVWGLAGDDSLKTSYSYNFYDHYLIGGSGNDTYTIRGDVVAIIYEAPNHGNNDSLYLSSNYYYYGYAASIDNKHLFAIYDDQAVFVLDAWENKGIENIYLGNYAYTSTYFLQLLPSLPGYLGNVSWDELKPYAGDITINTAKSVINEIKSATKSVESDYENTLNILNNQISSLESQVSDLNKSTEEVLHSNQSVGTSYHLTAIRDYDGNFHANTGSVSDATKTSYKYQGLIDVNADGKKEAIYTNKESGRWVTASINSSTGEIDYSDHGSVGTTRVVGIYQDPLVASGDVISGSDHDSQRRFQNDLYIDNLIVKTSGDFDSDGDQEVYWKTNDGTAYLRALMHADGNIQYANYQSEEQMSNYLTSNGYESVIGKII